jgi:hypothetical protein
MAVTTAQSPSGDESRIKTGFAYADRLSSIPPQSRSRNFRSRTQRSQRITAVPVSQSVSDLVMLQPGRSLLERDPLHEHRGQKQHQRAHGNDRTADEDISHSGPVARSSAAKCTRCLFAATCR